ncbi:hypothetical protein PDJAM_G00200140, partial [Pangasius djambal]|nr:hypothetical protein [Pangasius djambal]
TGERNNIERPGRPRKTTKVDDRRILSLVKKNPFTTSKEVKNTLEKVGVSLSKSTIQRCLHECKYRRVYNKVQTTGNIQEQESQIRLCQKTSKKKKKASYVLE